MSEILISKFADEIGLPAELLLEKLKAAGINKSGQNDSLSQKDKMKLLDFLRGSTPKSTTAVKVPKKKMTEIKKVSNLGKTRTIEIKVKSKKRIPQNIIKDNNSNNLTPDSNITSKMPKKTVKSSSTIKQNLEQKNQVESEISSVNEFKKKSLESEKKNLVTELKQDKVVKKTDEKKNEKDFTKSPTKKKEQLDFLKKKTEINKSLATRDGVWKNRNRLKKTKSIDKSESTQITPEFIAKTISVPETIVVSDLAHKMSVKSSEVIKVLMKLGQMATINQSIDQDTAMILVEEMGHKAVIEKVEDPEVYLSGQIDSSELKVRPPIVTIMGHVDHGKTTLLDYIRNTRVAQGESGGITQHIGAYNVDTKKGEIAFLDTPGHAAFSAMRARGSTLTDIVILVVAADDGVKPQTIESINHSKSANIPIIIAVNKIDKPEANAEKVKQELSNHNIVPEDWGGDNIFVNISAKSGEGVDQLLDAILLQAELLELKAPYDCNSKAIVVESRLDRGKGPVATLLIKSGTLKKGDSVLVGHTFGKIRAISDFSGKNLVQATPSKAVEIQGLSDTPNAGDEMVVLDDEKKIREIALFRQGKFREGRLSKSTSSEKNSVFTDSIDGERKVLPIIIKSDVQGSYEGLISALAKLNDESVGINVIHSAVGGVTDSDVNLAIAANAIIVGFNTRADVSAKKLIASNNINFKAYNIIYNVIDDVKALMEGLLSPDIKENILGSVEVRKTYKVSKIGVIAGCYVTEGLVKRNSSIRVLRDNIVLHDGVLDSLKRFKDDAKEVKSGFECGLSIKNYNDIKEGDILEVYESVSVARTLSGS